MFHIFYYHWLWFDHFSCWLLLIVGWPCLTVVDHGFFYWPCLTIINCIWPWLTIVEIICNVWMFLTMLNLESMLIKGYVALWYSSSVMMEWNNPKWLCHIETFNYVKLCQIVMFLNAYITLWCSSKVMSHCNFVMGYIRLQHSIIIKSKYVKRKLYLFPNFYTKFIN